MFLREGSQPGLTAVCCAALSTMFAVHTASAGESAPSVGVELPREVLPWRRDVENLADGLLRNARRSAQFGDPDAAERQFRELIEKFPRTNAAADGARAWAALKDKRIGTGRRGLGSPPGTAPSVPLNPVGGWETSVTPDSGTLSEALIEAAGDRVFFAEGSTHVSARAAAVLKRQALWLRSKPEILVRLVGHADDQGTSESNMRLSHDRAAAVRRKLISFGVEPRRVRMFSQGRAQPIAICAVSRCGAQNRRVVTEISSAQQAAASPD